MKHLFHRYYLFLIIATILLSCNRDSIVEPVEPGYTKEEFELACEDLLYATFIEHRDAGLTRNFNNIKSFLKRDDLPEGIMDSINNYVYKDYLTYFPDGIEPEIFNYLNLRLKITIPNSFKRKRN